MEHIGEMVAYGADNLTPVDPEGWLRKLVRFAKEYVANGTCGTQVERATAMLTIKRKLYTKMTGRDPDADTHDMNCHWLPIAELDE